MTRQPKGERNLDGYGAPVIPWTKVCELLEEGMVQIAPGSGIGRPGAPYLLAGDGAPRRAASRRPRGCSLGRRRRVLHRRRRTRKAKNLAHDRVCVITVATAAFDLVAEGEATKVTDEATLEHVAERYSVAGWSPTVRDGAL